MQGLSKTGSDLSEALVLEILSKLDTFQNNLRNNNLNLLHKGFCGDTRDGVHSFSQLSTEKGQSFSVKQNFHLPFSGKGEGIETSFDTWVMNESWTKQFSIESVPGVEMLLGFWKNGEFFIELVLFDPSTRELKNLGIHASKWTMQITAYVESLVPINGRSEHEGRDASN
ncbi:hypothetical protein V6N13_083403 [Hibiscus sabdariffa]